jgi:hypothetical protein
VAIGASLPCRASCPSRERISCGTGMQRSTKLEEKKKGSPTEVRGFPHTSVMSGTAMRQRLESVIDRPMVSTSNYIFIYLLFLFKLQYLFLLKCHSPSQFQSLTCPVPIQSLGPTLVHPSARTVCFVGSAGSVFRLRLWLHATQE